jgi:hypothetical protein
MGETTTPNVSISQSVAILVDGNNIERSIHDLKGDPHTMINFDTIEVSIAWSIFGKGSRFPPSLRKGCTPVITARYGRATRARIFR